MKALLTPRQLAEATGVTQSQISLVLNGKRWPSRELAKRLERATGISRDVWVWWPLHNPYMKRAQEPQGIESDYKGSPES